METTNCHSHGAHYGLMDRQGDDANSSGSYHTPPANLGQDRQENFTHYPDLERPPFPQLPVLTAAILMYGRRLESEVSYLYTGKKCEANTQAHVETTSESTSLTPYACFRIFKPGINAILMPFLQSVLNRGQRITKAECLDPSYSSATTPGEK